MSMNTRLKKAGLGFKQFSQKVAHSAKRNVVDKPLKGLNARQKAARKAVGNAIIPKETQAPTQQTTTTTTTTTKAQKLKKFGKSVLTGTGNAAKGTANFALKNLVSKPLKMATSLTQRVSANLGDTDALKATHKSQVEQDFKGKFKGVTAHKDLTKEKTNPSKLNINASDTAFVSTLMFLKDVSHPSEELKKLSENKLKILLDAFDDKSFTKKRAYVEHIFVDDKKGLDIGKIDTVKKAIDTAYDTVTKEKRDEFDTAFSEFLHIEPI